MRRSIPEKHRFLGAMALLVLGAAAAGSGARASDADSASVGLEAELDALFRELDAGEVPLLAPDRSPDLVIASTRQVLGELAPCG